jgi:hypothetical protein
MKFLKYDTEKPNCQFQEEVFGVVKHLKAGGEVNEAKTRLTQAFSARYPSTEQVTETRAACMLRTIQRELAI